MNNTNHITSTVKRGRGRPARTEIVTESENAENADKGVPFMFEPNVHDINDELSRMDSYVYPRYRNEE